MKLAVIGAGVAGVTTAFELAQDGHEVTVYERGATAAEGASFANAGLLAPEWAAARASLEWKRKDKSAKGRWWNLLKRQRRHSYPDPGPGILALAQLGAGRLELICDRWKLPVDSHQGMMVVLRDQRDVATAEELQPMVRDMGAECHLMPSEQARALELALNTETPLSGTMVMPGAWSVNCRQFTLLLKALAQQEGCRFEFGRSVTAIEPGAQTRLTFGAEAERFDGVVVCAGAASHALLGSVGVELPLETWSGHTLSATVRESIDAPVAVVHDLRHGVEIARMGQRVRVSSPLHRGARTERTGTAFTTLYQVLDDWFPGAIRLGQAGGVQEWGTDVSVSPDGLPVVGETSAPRLWVNTGHGMHGWVMAGACARLLADQIAGQASSIDTRAYGAQRWQSCANEVV